MIKKRFVGKLPQNVTKDVNIVWDLIIYQNYHIMIMRKY